MVLLLCWGCKPVTVAITTLNKETKNFFQTLKVSRLNKSSMRSGHRDIERCGMEKFSRRIGGYGSTSHSSRIWSALWRSHLVRISWRGVFRSRTAFWSRLLISKWHRLTIKHSNDLLSMPYISWLRSRRAWKTSPACSMSVISDRGRLGMNQIASTETKYYELVLR